MNLHLENKVIIVTGGAQGIGRSIVARFVEEGAQVCIIDRQSQTEFSPTTSSASIHKQVDYYCAEIIDEQRIQEIISEIVTKHKRIDVIVNNAGKNDAVGIRHAPAQFRDSLNQNLVSTFVLLHYALDALIDSRGCIVNIGSKCSVTGQGGTSGYAASKGALNALTREWALDLARFGIRVNCVIPAEVITPLYEDWLSKTPDPVKARQQLNETIPLERRTTTTEEVADMVVFVASNRSSHTTGQLLFVDGGYVHLDRACTQNTSHLKTS